MASAVVTIVGTLPTILVGLEPHRTVTLVQGEVAAEEEESYNIIHSLQMIINNMCCIFIGWSGKVTVETI